ncbi:MAG: hypothetical protein J6N52_06460 [Clostridia bacterium]|nr:hypothetical protein [Clostridia bacterium]
MVVSFCGHGDVQYSDEIRESLYTIIEDLIKQGADEFLLGGYGSFDLMAAHTVKSLKEKYPYIESVLVVAYINRGFDKDLYDCSEYPPIENVPKRFAILKRNEWMVKNADVIVAYISHDWGGAAKTLSYARQKKKRIINIFAE